MTILSVDSLKEQIEKSLKEKGVTAEDTHYAEDGSWAVVIFSSGPDMLYGVKKSWLVVFINGKPEKTGSLYSAAFSGEDFYYSEFKLVKVLSAEQNNKIVTLKVLKENHETREFKFKV
jgi:hypothetical protein